ncbi:MAG: phosphate ABC transporter permease PstA [bacterium]|nr:phosphate ABC transporter permease PstA [bacterium]
MPNSKEQQAFVKAEIKKFWREGEYNVWFSTLSIGGILLMALTLLVVVVINGLGALWPADLVQVKTEDGRTYLGELKQTGVHPLTKEARFQLKIGNRDLYPLDFKWIESKHVTETQHPEEAIALEREEYGNFYGYLKRVQSPALTREDGGLEALRMPAANAREKLESLNDEIKSLSQEMQSVRLDIQAIKYHHPDEPERPELIELGKKVRALRFEFDKLVHAQGVEQSAALMHVAVFEDVEGKTREIPMIYIHRYYYPNQMNWAQKTLHYLAKILELFIAEPRESNTEGGLYPAIVGTVMLVMIMSMFSFPLGVIAAVYLREYARKGVMVQAIRVAVNNLAGIPSIVWGIFGLAFFIYAVGGGIDAVFFPERSPNPTFGTGGVLWASATLGLLTVPVVIVATEEALGSVPGEIRHGSLALGATQFQTLMRVILPMASPRIMTGFILAMSRAAGEVAPLMITGVVKLAPSLPIDTDFPFVHLERKFMHLGFHIYDVGFQSPNVEAAKPMVFVTTLLLLGVVVTLTSASIFLRNRMKKRFAGRTF